MMTQITQSDTGKLHWSPDRTKLAYITSQLLQAYIVETGRNRNHEERYVRLATGDFDQLCWSPDGNHLCATTTDGALQVFRFTANHARCVYTTTATSLEWLDAQQLLYIPTDGGLVMLDLGGKPVEVKLAG
jgi:Tol biopolymer transport system component